MYSANDTIAAIATSPGESAIGIVRISGAAALKIADKIFKSKDKKNPSAFKTYTIHYGYLVDKDKIVDETILTVMRRPRSFTKEDVVEINCHGGIVALGEVLDLVLASGARLAEPGEFTKRAFLNGRIDLTQAEAVLDIIRAKTAKALMLGTEQLKGALSIGINSLRNSLLKILAILEANIDFPDEEIESVDLRQIKNRLGKISGELQDILAASAHGRILREGILVVICGKPNVGKSSLLNALLKHERSIVTPIAGTTRDTIEEIIDIKGIPVRIVDTAGIIEPAGLIEKKAILRSKRLIGLADLVILLFDGARGLDGQDDVLIKNLSKKPLLPVINKIDLKQRIEKDRLEAKFKHIVQISAKESKNINLLEEAIAGFVSDGRISSSEYAIVSNMRHIEALKQAQRNVLGAKKALKDNLGIELVSQDIKDALGFLDDILGKRFSEKLLDKIFSEFCIGK